MARKDNRSGASAREKAKAMREAQKRQDARVRNIIIVVISVIVIAVIGAVVAVIATSGSKQQAAPGDAQPIVVSSLGVGERNPEVEDLDIYYSYTCHACADFEVAVGPQLAEDAAAGKFNLVYHPVATAQMQFIGPATNAALAVAAEAPEYFVPFNHALLAFADEQINELGDPTIIQDLDLSAKTVADIAKEVGVPANVIATFGTDADEYLQAANKIWSDTEVEGRDGLATPEIVFDGTAIRRQGGTNEEQYAALIDAIDALRSENN